MTFVPIRIAVIIAQAKPATIRQWAKRGKVATTIDPYTRHVVYAIADLVHMERTTRERAEARSLTSAA